jgi:hypothetical protein
MNLSVDAACRNALNLVAHRYQVTRQQIVEAAPLLFFIIAEQCLKELRWSPELGQWVRLGSLLRRTDLGDGQAETVFG